VGSVDSLKITGNCTYQRKHMTRFVVQCNK
jgi:hypothetical protein